MLTQTWIASIVAGGCRGGYGRGFGRGVASNGCGGCSFKVPAASFARPHFLVVALLAAVTRSAQRKPETRHSWIATRVALAVAQRNALVFRDAFVPNQTRVVAVKLLVGSIEEGF